MLNKFRIEAAVSSAGELVSGRQDVGASMTSHICQNIKRLATGRRALCLLAFAVVTMTAWADQVDEKKARTVAAKILKPAVSTRSASADTAVSQKTLPLIYKSSSKSANGTALRSAQTEETVYFYVFATEKNDGFVIVSGEDRVLPVLGYSNENGFSAEDMPENLKWWLGEYAKQIQFAIDNDIKPSVEVKRQWADYLGTDPNGKEEQR